jgi:hypothetical protein
MSSDGSRIVFTLPRDHRGEMTTGFGGTLACDRSDDLAVI